MCLNQDGRLCCSYVIRCGESGRAVGYDGVVAGSPGVPQLAGPSHILPHDETSIATIETTATNDHLASADLHRQMSASSVATSPTSTQQQPRPVPHMEDESSDLHNQVSGTVVGDNMSAPSSNPPPKLTVSQLVGTNVNKQSLVVPTSMSETSNVGSPGKTTASRLRSREGTPATAEQRQTTRVADPSAVSAEKVMFVSDGTEPNSSNKTYGGDAG